ncbi:MAG: DUF2125 domain-containing protein [Paracoccaceae bacterium]
MKNLVLRPLACGAAIALLIPTTALADVTALQVWEGWKSFAENFGQTVSVGSQSVDGGALILRDVRFTTAFPDGSAVAIMDLLEFRERGDGTVSVTLSEDFPLTVSVDPEIGEVVEMKIVLRQSGTSIIASGEDDDITFDYLSSSIGLSLDSLVVDAVSINPEVQVLLSGIDGQYALKTGDTKTYASQFAAEVVNIEFDVIDPEEGGRIAVSGSIEDIRSRSNTVVPADFDVNDTSSIFNSDFAVEGEFSAAGSGFKIDILDGEDTTSLTTSSGGSAFGFRLGDCAIRYSTSATEVQYDVLTTQLPLPTVTLSFAELAFDFLMPLGKSDEAKDFSFLTRIAGLEISNVLWSMFDPGEILPREPATFVVDIAGQVKWLIDITDPQQTAAFEAENEGVNPGEMESLTINELTLSAVGAEVTGAGMFTFDNTDLETFDGFPAPTGVFDARLVGLNTLLDRLIEMGIASQDQAVGARMMLGLFARPADGEDTLTSTLEINGDGTIFANGQQLR